MATKKAGTAKPGLPDLPESVKAKPGPVKLTLSNGIEIWIPRELVNVNGKESSTGKSLTHLFSSQKVLLNGRVSKLRVQWYTPLGQRSDDVEEVTL